MNNNYTTKITNILYCLLFYNAILNINPCNAQIISTIAGDGVGDGLVATRAWMNSPNSVAVDSFGNIYIADYYNCRVRKVDVSGTITTIAGTGVPGYSGDGDVATLARLHYPAGVAVDIHGNIYVADEGNDRIRKINTSGVITSIAGNGYNSPTAGGYSGDGGPATAAALFWPDGVTLDTSGNVFIADTYNNCIRKIDVSGIITTIAGSGIAGFSGDDSAATIAKLNEPPGVAVDGVGNIFIADYNNSRIRKVDVSGKITSIAGNGILGASGDGGLAAGASLRNPSGVIVVGNGSIYVADQGNNRIRKIDTSGIITTVAGSGYGSPGTGGFGGDGGLATAAELFWPASIAVNSSGKLIIADTYNNRIRIVNGSNLISTLAGNGTTGYDGDNFAATGAELNMPSGVAIDGSGNLFIADYSNNAIRKVDASGIITTVAGNGVYGYSGDGGSATTAALRNPNSIALDGSGSIFFVDYQNFRVRKINPAGIITTVAGNGTAGDSGDGGPATAAELNWPYSVAVDLFGNFFISEYTGNKIRRVDGLGIITTVVGNGTPGYLGDGGVASAAELLRPMGIALDDSGILYIADAGNACIRMVKRDGIISTIAGTGTHGFGGDGGMATNAQLYSPSGLTVDGNGNVYVADYSNDRIRKVNNSGIISEIAGDGFSGCIGDGGEATAAQINFPSDVVIDGSGNLFIADTYNNRIRKVSLMTEVPNIKSTQTSIVVFPNPTTECVNIQSVHPVDIELMTIDGRILYNNQDTQKVSLVGFPNGIYLLKISDHYTGIHLTTTRVLKMDD